MSNASRDLAQQPAALTHPETSRHAEGFAALRKDLLPFAHRRLGSLRIDVADVRVILAALDIALGNAEPAAGGPILPGTNNDD
jgi:hypothetical protein